MSPAGIIFGSAIPIEKSAKKIPAGGKFAIACDESEQKGKESAKKKKKSAKSTVPLLQPINIVLILNTIKVFYLSEMYKLKMVLNLKEMIKIISSTFSVVV